MSSSRQRVFHFLYFSISQNYACLHAPCVRSIPGCSEDITIALTNRFSFALVSFPKISTALYCCTTVLTFLLFMTSLTAVFEVLYSKLHCFSSFESHYLYCDIS